MNPVALQRRTPRRGTRVEVPAPAKEIRAAIYCRKSTDENLHSDFSSLDAQRESCLAYVASMKSEGWVALPETYEDGGFSGGTTDRPALQRLLSDIGEGKIDAVVVVKIDRLSRSLLQFLQLMEFFEEHDTAFCAVTQSLDSSTPTGRLMIGILMSFAQFERELGSERTREKIHAARKKGRYTGGCPPLGYDADTVNHCLVVNPDEAAMVRAFFDLYLQHRSLLRVVKDVNARGWRKKTWRKQDGVSRGGGPFDKVYLQRLLTNPLYIGQVTLHGETYPGLHEALVDEETFRVVGELLVANRNCGDAVVRNKHNAFLRRILRCGRCGAVMTHSWSRKGTHLYRYYCCLTAQKQGRAACLTPSLAAGQIEAVVVQEIKRLAQDPVLIDQILPEAVQMADSERELLETERTRLLRQRQQPI